jgi:hypothetical protein
MRAVPEGHACLVERETSVGKMVPGGVVAVDLHGLGLEAFAGVNASKSRELLVPNCGWLYAVRSWISVYDHDEQRAARE